MAVYGVIDLGSNSIRLVIFEVEREKGITRFHSIINDKVIAGLSSYVEDGVFTPEGVKKAAEVLSGHLSRAAYFSCRRIDIFATAVLRNCKNSSSVVREIELIIGAPIHLLSATEEAYLGFVGATHDRGIDGGTLIDIGGGSTELTAIVKGCDVSGVSLGIGSVSSYAEMVSEVLPTPKEARTIKNAFSHALDGVSNLDAYKTEQLYGIGGSARAATKLYNVAFNDSSAKPKSLSREELDRLCDLMLQDRPKFAHIAAKAIPERMHTGGPGCLIVQTLMERLGAKRLNICRFGLREGYLLERMLSDDIN